jgi:uncharacterized protein
MALQQDNVVNTPAAASPGSGLADPGPLGLAGFAMTTFVLSTINTNMVSGAVGGVVLGLALFYGGLAQLLAGMWEFVKGNTFGAVAFASFGAFWMSFWYLSNNIPKASGVDIDHGLGLYLLAWAIFTAYMTIAATRVSGVVLAVFFFLTLTFIALCVGKFAANPAAVTPDGWTKLGGWLGLVTAALAWYGSLAAVMNATAKRVVFPTFPR